LRWLGSLFYRQKHQNPAIDALYRKVKTADSRTEEFISLLPKLAAAMEEGRDYLYRKVLEAQIIDFDEHYGSHVFEKINDTKKTALLNKLTGFMLISYFNELSELYPDTELPSSLTDALHFEIYGALPSKDSFAAYLTYKNPNFDDASMAPAFKFGNDVADILETYELSFPLMISQQSPLIRQISKKIIRLVLFDEPIEAGPKIQ